MILQSWIPRPLIKYRPQLVVDLILQVSTHFQIQIQFVGFKSWQFFLYSCTVSCYPERNVTQCCRRLRVDLLKRAATRSDGHDLRPSSLAFESDN